MDFKQIQAAWLAFKSANPSALDIDEGASLSKTDFDENGRATITDISFGEPSAMRMTTPKKVGVSSMPFKTVPCDFVINGQPRRSNLMLGAAAKLAKVAEASPIVSVTMAERDAPTEANPNKKAYSFIIAQKVATAVATTSEPVLAGATA